MQAFLYIPLAVHRHAFRVVLQEETLDMLHDAMVNDLQACYKDGITVALPMSWVFLFRAHKAKQYSAYPASPCRS